jgi:hypothetical protein
MINYYETINEELRGKIEKNLNLMGTDPSILSETAHYFFSLAKMMDGLRRAYTLWLDKENNEPVGTREFFIGTLSMIKLLKKMLDNMDGIVGTYISGIEIPPDFASPGNQPWHFQGHAQNYKQMKGIFPALRDAGLSQDFIDMYYLDGTLLEVYEDCTEVIPAITALASIRQASPVEIREGIFLIENRFRNLYAKLFMERFENAYGLTGVMIEALKELDKLASGQITGIPPATS